MMVDCVCDVMPTVEPTSVQFWVVHGTSEVVVDQQYTNDSLVYTDPFSYQLHEPQNLDFLKGPQHFALSAFDKKHNTVRARARVRYQLCVQCVELLLRRCSANADFGLLSPLSYGNVRRTAHDATSPLFFPERAFSRGEYRFHTLV